MLQKLKTAYILWHSYHQTLPKDQRYSLGQRIDSLFVEAIEFVAIAAFLSQTEKPPYVRLAIRKVDTLKILLMILWETKSLDDKKYIALSEQLNEIGKMLGGWKRKSCTGVQDLIIVTTLTSPKDKNQRVKKR